MTLGEAIRTRRQGLGLTQEQLADQAGVSQANLSRLERGNQGAGRSTLRGLENALGLEKGALLVLDPGPASEMASDASGEQAPATAAA